MAHRSYRQSGFTLLEALIALLVMAFGMLALAGMQLNLSRNADIAKQRTEATRLAEERIERMRSFVGIATGAINWNTLSAASETVTADAATKTNTTFKIAPSLGGAIADAMRPVSVIVRWMDRTGSDPVNDGTGFLYNQQVTVDSVISKSDPADSGFLGNPLPANANLKRPKNRHINIPYPALSLPGGRSSYQFDPTFAIVFNDDTGNVILQCSFVVTTTTNVDTDCTAFDGYAVAGYLGRTATSVAWPTGINHSAVTRNTAGASAIRCTFSDARDQNTGALITADNGYKYYLCVIPLSAPFLWGGTIRIGGVTKTSNYFVCRYQYTQTTVTDNERNIQPYANVALSIDQQNYLVTNHSNGLCPASMTVSGVSVGVRHQDCRTSNAANHGTECPAPSP